MRWIVRQIRNSSDVLVEFIAMIVIAAFVLAMCGVACGQTYQINVRYSNGQAGTGSAVCVGQGLKQGQWVFLTAGHVLNKGKSASVGGHRVSNVTFARRRQTDLASFEISTGQFEKTAIIRDWPDGIPAQVCGYGVDRESFCFAGSITRHQNGGRIWAQNQHTVPGDSGGAVMIQTGQRQCLAGIHWGYGCSQGRCDSEFVTSEQICEHLTQVYGDCPDCQQWPQVIPRQPPPMQQRPQLPPVNSQPSRPPSVVIAPCQDDLRNLVAEYMAANPVASGRDGRDGQTPEVDYEQIVRSVVEAIPRPRDGVDGAPGPPGRDGQSASAADVAQYLIANHRAELTGPAGQAGPQGEPGLVGVPSSQDIRGWLIGAMSDPETRLMLSQLLVELAAEDPRTADLIGRLEAIENRPRSQRVLIMDGKGNVLDDETFRDGEPIVLDVRQFTAPAKP